MTNQLEDRLRAAHHTNNWLRRHLHTIKAALATTQAALAAEQALAQRQQDDDEDHEPIPAAAPDNPIPPLLLPHPAAANRIGGRLRELWAVVGGRAKRGRAAGGRDRMTGRAMIQNAANKILANATARPLPASPDAAPCQIAAATNQESRGRPTWSLRIPPREGEGDGRQITPMAYHVTWCAANNQPPPDDAEGYSHLCREKRCVEPTHGV